MEQTQGSAVVMKLLSDVTIVLCFFLFHRCCEHANEDDHNDNKSSYFSRELENKLRTRRKVRTKAAIEGRQEGNGVSMHNLDRLTGSSTYIMNVFQETTVVNNVSIRP